MKTALALLLLFASNAFANVFYTLDLTVTDIWQRGTLPYCQSHSQLFYADPPPTFGCNVQVGDTFHGSLSIDNALLGTDGLIRTPLSDFYLKVNDIVWDQRHPAPWGFAGYFDNAPIGLDDMPGIGPVNDILAGDLIGLYTKVYSGGDHNRIYFSGNQFDTRDQTGDEATDVGGLVVFTRVSEPSTLALLIGSLLILVQRRRS